MDLKELKQGSRVNAKHLAVAIKFNLQDPSTYFTDEEFYHAFDKQYTSYCGRSLIGIQIAEFPANYQPTNLTFQELSISQDSADLELEEEEEDSTIQEWQNSDLYYITLHFDDKFDDKSFEMKTIEINGVEVECRALDKRFRVSAWIGFREEFPDIELRFYDKLDDGTWRANQNGPRARELKSRSGQKGDIPKRTAPIYHSLTKIETPITKKLKSNEKKNFNDSQEETKVELSDVTHALLNSANRRRSNKSFKIKRDLAVLGGESSIIEYSSDTSDTCDVTYPAQTADQSHSANAQVKVKVKKSRNKDFEIQVECLAQVSDQLESRTYQGRVTVHKEQNVGENWETTYPVQTADQSHSANAQVKVKVKKSQDFEVQVECLAQVSDQLASRSFEGRVTVRKEQKVDENTLNKK